MSGKHTTGQFGLPRYSFIAAAATLLVILVAWVAVRAAGPSEQKAPVMVVPSSPAADAGFALPPPSTIPVASPSATASPSPSASRSSSRPASPSSSPRPSRTSAAPKPTERAPTTPASAFTARYRTGASWDQGFIGAVEVTNTGSAARGWRVSVTYSSRAGVQIINAWNAQLSRSGDTWTFTATDLAPGATATFGFQATKRSRDGVRPSGCVVNGTPCRMG